MPAPALASNSGVLGRLDHEVSRRCAQLEDVAELNRVVQERRHLTVGRAVHAPNPAHGDLQPVAHAVDETVYCRGCRFPSGRLTKTETY